MTEFIIVGWQWMDTAIFRRRLPKYANKEEWRPIYVKNEHGPYWSKQ